MSRTLFVTLEIECESLSEQELLDSGFGDFMADEPPEDYGVGATVEDYDADEIADLIPFVLSAEDIQSEMFAGSNIFAKITGVRKVSAGWIGK